MKNIAAALAAKGRGPDTTLVHMSQPEVTALAKMAGVRSLPKNPETGLPEAGLLSMVLPLVAAWATGGQSLWMQALAGAGAGAAGAGLEGGNMLRGGLMGGIAGGIGGAAGVGDLGASSAELSAGTNMAGQTARAGEIGASTGETLAANTTGGGISGLPQTQQIMTGQGYSGMYGATPAQEAGQFFTGNMPVAATTNAATPAATMLTPIEGYTAGQGAQMAQRAIPTGTPNVGEQLMSTDTPQMPVYADGTTPGFSKQVTDAMMMNPKTTAALAGAGIYGLNQMMQPKTIPPVNKSRMLAGPSTSGITQTGVAPVYGGAENQYFANNTPSNYTTGPSYLSGYAEGGQVTSGDLFNAPLMPSHQRQSMDSTVAHGGAPGYAAGGILTLRSHAKHMNPLFTRGPGDGMSDSIPAVIDGQGKRPNEPIRVADSEYIVPADAVAHLGNGSSNAGAKKMDAMVAKVRKAKTGKTKQPAEMNMSRFMPA